MKKHLDKIDFKTKKVKKSKRKLRNVPKDAATAIKKIAKLREQILVKFEEKKDELHENNDPAGLDEVSQIFDVRLWPANQTQEELKDLKNELKIKLKEAEQFFIGEDISDLENELNQACEMLYHNINSSLLQKVRNSDRIFKQWDSILEHPLLNDCNVLCNISERVSLLPNSEAGCEQTISKFNRTKNKFSTSMHIDTI